MINVWFSILCSNICLFLLTIRHAFSTSVWTVRAYYRNVLFYLRRYYYAFLSGRIYWEYLFFLHRHTEHSIYLVLLQNMLSGSLCSRQIKVSPSILGYLFDLPEIPWARSESTIGEYVPPGLVYWDIRWFGF